MTCSAPAAEIKGALADPMVGPGNLRNQWSMQIKSFELRFIPDLRDIFRLAPISTATKLAKVLQYYCNHWIVQKSHRININTNDHILRPLRSQLLPWELLRYVLFTVVGATCRKKSCVEEFSARLHNLPVTIGNSSSTASGGAGARHSSQPADFDDGMVGDHLRCSWCLFWCIELINHDYIHVSQ